MSALLCLQGGDEFAAACRPMDELLLERVPAGPLVVTTLAGSPGRDYERSTANGVRYYRALGADAVAAPDARADEESALAALREAATVVLPGGSPARLRAALVETGVGELIRTRWRAGESAVIGSSAGAMLLCELTVLPDAGRVVSGLGLVPGAVVVPHWSGGWRWRRQVEAAAPAGTRLVGIPEHSGVLIDGAEWTAVGEREYGVLELS